MDESDKKLFLGLSEGIPIPNKCKSIVENALKDNKKMKKLKIKQMIKAIITAFMGLFLTGGVVFATNTIYQKIWKEPKMYHSYEEYQEKLKQKENEYKASTIITDDDIEKIENEEQAKQKATEVMETLGYDTSKIKTVELKKNYVESAELVYVVRTKKQNLGIEIIINAETGKFESFSNNDLMYNYNSITPDKLTQEEAKKMANDIYLKLGYKEGVYILDEIEESPHCFGSQSTDEWSVIFNKKGKYVKNTMDYLALSFVVQDEKVNIDSFLHRKINDFEYQDNEIEISKEKAIEIAKEQDRKITDREIEGIETELSIGTMNSFVYLQEKSHGTEDGLRIVEEDDSSFIYNTYEETDKIARNVWNVHVKYEKIKDFSKTTDKKDLLNRDYYVDATTGEIIGGNWGMPNNDN